MWLIIFLSIAFLFFTLFSTSTPLIPIIISLLFLFISLLTKGENIWFMIVHLLKVYILDLETIQKMWIWIFLNGLRELLTFASNTVDNYETSSDDLIESLSSNQGFGKEDLLELTKDFFGTLSPVYQKKFEDIISTGTIKLEENPTLSMADSDASKLILTGNYSVFPTLVHESTHNFNNSPKNRSILHILLGEADAICMEQLAIDYLKSQKNINLDCFYTLREIDFAESDFFECKDIMAFINLFNAQKNGDIDFNDDSLKAAKTLYPYRAPIRQLNSLNSNFSMTMSGFSHQLGYILANYIHEKISEDPGNIKMLESVIQCVSMEDYQEEEAIKILSENGIPIVKDGKLSLDPENINLLEIYLKKSHERRNYDRTEESNHHSSKTAGQKSVDKLVTEAINDTPDLSVLDEISPNLGDKELGKDESIIY